MPIELSPEIDYRGKTVVIQTHLVVPHIEQIREDLRASAKELDGNYRLDGFVLGILVDQSVYDQSWVQFAWNSEPLQIKQENLIRVLLDDEPEPEVVNGLPRLV